MHIFLEKPTFNAFWLFVHTKTKAETFQNGGQRLCKYKEQKPRFTNTPTSQPNRFFRIPSEQKFVSRYVFFLVLINET